MIHFFLNVILLQQHFLCYYIYSLSKYVIFPLDDFDVDKGTKLHILSLFRADVPEVVATAAAAGDSATVFSYLSKHPEEVSK